MKIAGHGSNHGMNQNRQQCPLMEATKRESHNLKYARRKPSFPSDQAQTYTKSVTRLDEFGYQQKPKGGSRARLPITFFPLHHSPSGSQRDPRLPFIALPRTSSAIPPHLTFPTTPPPPPLILPPLGRALSLITPDREPLSALDQKAWMRELGPRVWLRSRSSLLSCRCIYVQH
ncbi:hypothetical protein BDV28DRAFT_38150 [Aspergillus coremiiformis]|uniref:Uncharacterized protein n=1 Tax=Aspergillus coremiiformis TaxID=138285 RepID=A0A5N6ZCY6_9EURO|nr:hypothetical protein BDV28DRAFT_38150 [Aspergillus coremiiformis]